MINENMKCGLSCTHKNCNKFCEWVINHKIDDNLHLCSAHIKEFEEDLIKKIEEEEEKLSGYRGMDCD